MDSLSLAGIELQTCLGVPVSERKKPQRVLVSITLFADLQKAGQLDDVSQSVDYAVVRQAIITLAATPRKTIEKLAEDIAQAILKQFPIRSVEVTVTKFPFADTKSVSATITRVRT